MSVKTVEQIETDVEIIPFEKADPAKDKAHIIRAMDNLHISRVYGSNDMVDVARMMGLELIALCGHRWIPSKNPNELPVCVPCMKKAHELLSEGGVL